MDRWNWTTWARQWGLDDATQLAWAAGALAFVLLGGLWWMLQRRRAAHSGYEPGEDEFALSAPITENQMSVMRYLNQAFPDGMVLFRPPLARFVFVRKSLRKRAARQHLGNTTVDFLVCTEEGRPLVAFEVDAFRDAKDPEAQRRVMDKARLLMSAGIRLIRLKGALGNLPTASELRTRLYESQRLAGGQGGLGTASTFSQTGAAPSSFGHTEAPSTFSEEMRAWAESRNRAIPINDQSAWQLVGKHD